MKGDSEPMEIGANEGNYGTTRWITLLEGVSDPTTGSGYVNEAETALEVVKQFETHTTTKFIKVENPANFGCTDLYQKTHKVQWEHRDIVQGHTLVPFDGTPFMLLATKLLECQHGRDRNTLKKKKYAEKNKDNLFMKHRFLKCATKKLGCKAKITVHEVMRFPEYKIKNASRWKREAQSKAIRKDLYSRASTQKQERRLYICLPSAAQHTGHTIGELSSGAVCV